MRQTKTVQMNYWAKEEDPGQPRTIEKQRDGKISSIQQQQ
jgi:hypothetical protein